MRTERLCVRDWRLKIIVVKDRIKLWRNEEGIVVMGIMDFLLDPNSLELWSADLMVRNKHNTPAIIKYESLDLNGYLDHLFFGSPFYHDQADLVRVATPHHPLSRFNVPWIHFPCWTRPGQWVPAPLSSRSREYSPSCSHILFFQAQAVWQAGAEQCRGGAERTGGKDTERWTMKTESLDGNDRLDTSLSEQIPVWDEEMIFIPHRDLFVLWDDLHCDASYPWGKGRNQVVDPGSENGSFWSQPGC